MNDINFNKNIKKRNKSKDILMSFNIVNLLNDLSLKNISFIPKIKLKNNNINAFKSSKKANQGTNTVYSNTKKVKNKNKHNYYNVKKKRNLLDFDEKKKEGDYDTTTIRSNGKFQATQNEKFMNKTNKQFVIKQNVKQIFLNKDINNFNYKDNHKVINKEENNKKDWKGLNISSHYLGNTFNNKFGITSNKFYINKDLILLHAKNNKRYINSYNENSSLLKKNSEKKLKFITLNMPNQSNFFNAMSSINLFSGPNCVINNQKLYQKLIKQMTIVFKNRIKKYSYMKSFDKRHHSLFNEENKFPNNIMNIKQKKMFNNNSEVSQIKKIIHERNDVFKNVSRDKYDTFDMHNKYMKINIRNVNNRNKANKVTLSNDEMDMKIYKK